MKVILKPLDSHGYPGYGIATDGTVWSRLNTHGQITSQWSQRETYTKRGVRYVKLRVGGKTKECRVAELLLVAVFGPLPGWVGFKIRYGPGGYGDCRLENLRYALRGHHAGSMLGTKYAGTIPPGFSEVDA